MNNPTIHKLFLKATLFIFVAFYSCGTPERPIADLVRENDSICSEISNRLTGMEIRQLIAEDNLSSYNFANAYFENDRLRFVLEQTSKADIFTDAKYYLDQSGELLKYEALVSSINSKKLLYSQTVKFHNKQLLQLDTSGNKEYLLSNSAISAKLTKLKKLAK